MSMGENQIGNLKMAFKKKIVKNQAVYWFMSVFTGEWHSFTFKMHLEEFFKLKNNITGS